MLVYTYYSAPWDLRSGDDVRIHNVCKSIANCTRIIVYNLSHLVNQYTTIYKDGVLYVSTPRKFYSLVAWFLRWKNDTDLNPLIKLTHYVDEFITAAKLVRGLKQDNIIYIFGAMSLFSLFLRILKTKSPIIYDPLANYAQTLYLRSRKSLINLLKYGLYLALHKLQLRTSDYIVYPSNIDLKNAKQMFDIKRTIIIPNPFPICYENIDEYVKLRMKRKDFNIPYFVLLAGGKGENNKEAVKITIEIFNKLPPNKFRLIITGPWFDMHRYVKNRSIELVGVVSTGKLKEILATADYGLSPVFGHIAGTFLKTLAYIAAGLNIVTSPGGLQGIDKLFLKQKQIFLVRNVDEYKKVIFKIIFNPRVRQSNNSVSITLCDNNKNLELIVNNLHKLLINSSTIR